MGHYELAESADVYTQLMFSEYESVAQIAPGGNFFDTNTINCDNPFLSAAASSASWVAMPRPTGSRHRRQPGHRSAVHRTA